MSRPRKLTPGQRFGRLTVVRYERLPDGRAGILTVCDCGHERFIRNVSHLKPGSGVRLECIGHGGENAALAGLASIAKAVQERVRERIAAAKSPAEREAWESALGVVGAEGRRLRRKLREIYGATP